MGYEHDNENDGDDDDQLNLTVGVSRWIHPEAIHGSCDETKHDPL